MSDGPKIDVLIICALEEELDALREVERERSDGWAREPGNPPYWTATFNGDAGPIRVAAASLTEMGTAATTDVAVTLTDQLRPHCLAMCGVCAGHPDDTDLGDVIIAERVFQHDNGKLTVAGFQGNIWTRNTNRDWRRLAQELAGPAIGRHGFAAVDPDSDAGKWWLLERLRTGRKPLAPALSRYVPDARRQEFLESLLESKLLRLTAEGPTLTKAGGKAAEQRRFIHSAPVTSLPYHIHVGPIGSGNYVVADVGIWKRLAAIERKTIGVEMEAAALGTVAEGRGRRFLVVKGVMDHGDTHKSDRFKKFAARASAEVLCEFLRRVIEPEPAIAAPPERTPEFEHPTRERRFTGRSKELVDLERLISENETVCVVATGIGGIGKTTLVSQFVATRGRALFPDGVAWIDASPERFASDLARVSERFGWPTKEHCRAPTPDEAVDWLKATLPKKRALIVVDNLDPNHSEPKHVPIPGDSARTIVTSRTSTLDEDLRAARLPLGVWSLDVCHTYLRDNCSEDCPWLRTTSDADLNDLAEFVGCLPLGMRLLVSVLRRRTDLSPTELLALLRAQPLGTLDRYDRDRGVAATFRFAYDWLDEPERRVLQALAACAKQTRAEIIAAVADADLRAVGESLASLRTHGFAEIGEHRVWGMHDVVRMFVLAQPGVEEFERRQIQWVYRYLQEHADPTAYRSFAEGIAEARHAFAWLLRRDVVAAVLVVYHSVSRHFFQVGNYADMIELSNALLDAASRDSKEAAVALNNLGLCYEILGEVEKAIEHHERALAVDQRLGHPDRQANDLGNLGGCYRTLGEVGKAIEHYKHALAIDEKLGRLKGVASHVGNLGLCYRQLGDIRKAIEHHERSLALEEQLGSLEGQAHQLGNLGICYLALDDIPTAIEYLEHSLAFDEQLGRREGQANQLANLGLCYETLGEVAKAIDHHERALAINEKLGRLKSQANQLASLGLCHEQLGDAERARGLLNRASDLFRRMGLPDGHPSVAIVQRALERLA